MNSLLLIGLSCFIVCLDAASEIREFNATLSGLVMAPGVSNSGPSEPAQPPDVQSFPQVPDVELPPIVNITRIQADNGKYVRWMNWKGSVWLTVDDQVGTADGVFEIHDIGTGNPWHKNVRIKLSNEEWVKRYTTDYGNNYAMGFEEPDQFGIFKMTNLYSWRNKFTLVADKDLSPN